jgi:hypothetical protein
MLNDLKLIHGLLLEAYKAALLLSGVDLDALTKEGKVEILPTLHLPI